MEEMSQYNVDKIALRTCPWCGKGPTIRRERAEIEHGEHIVWFSIECETCHIQFRSPSIIDVDYYGVPHISQNGYLECIHLWNRRADDDDRV